MNRNRLSAVFVACTVLLTLITPLHAENNDASGSSISVYNNYLDGAVDETEFHETYNDKVLMYETMTSGMARQTTPLNKTLAVNFQTQENGYKKSGDVLVYTDPAYGRYPGTLKQQDISLSDMQYLCSTRGFVW